MRRCLEGFHVFFFLTLSPFFLLTQEGDFFNLPLLNISSIKQEHYRYIIVLFLFFFVCVCVFLFYLF